MQMSKVMRCEVCDCAYNTDGFCHTAAITIGDGTRPTCDTFCSYTSKGCDVGCIAGVAACNAFSCIYNRRSNCTAIGIAVGYKDQKPYCLMFEA